MFFEDFLLCDASAAEADVISAMISTTDDDVFDTGFSCR